MGGHLISGLDLWKMVQNVPLGGLPTGVIRSYETFGFLITKFMIISTSQLLHYTTQILYIVQTLHCKEVSTEWNTGLGTYGYLPTYLKTLAVSKYAMRVQCTTSWTPIFSANKRSAQWILEKAHREYFWVKWLKLS